MPSSTSFSVERVEGGERLRADMETGELQHRVHREPARPNHNMSLILTAPVVSANSYILSLTNRSVQFEILGPAGHGG